MSGFFFGDKADVAAALDAGSLHPTDILAVEAQTQVFLDVMGGNMIAHHLFPDEFAVFDNEVGAAFDQNAKCMGVTGHQREQAVKENQDNAATERRKKGGVAVDGPRQDGGENNEEDGVERVFTR